MAETVFRRGVIVAALTPFRGRTTRVEGPAFARQVAALARWAPAAIGVAGVESQEFQVLGRAARLKLVESTVDNAAGVPVLAGVSHPSLAESIALARESAQRGAAAVLAVASAKPWGAAPTGDEAHRWFATLADESPVPVVLYNNPRLGVDLSVDTIARIGAHPNVAAMKETSRDEAKLLGLLSHAAPGLAVYTNMELLATTLLLGGHGAMLPPSGLPVAQRVLAAAEAGDHAEIARWVPFFADFPSRWSGLGFLPAVKAATALMGLDLGRPLWPYDAIDGDILHELREYLRKWELLDVFSDPSGVLR
ncbi:dihydrodipicolinate synthase family protein [Amycolatopsis acidicola]|uniref:Dihydrodipicolinate synthase family protein n=1 Tax=Amycolatopsis acidicola TaxID=2596893 RepID=A0A5N0VBW7_9PSEU|nr:dihydrodipicolinate synthase family protein [Amycolatopsis acidicola]KAA9162630.1 dihydrodipicolinate synthase family protein [Amycolatopsis acidicola]